MVEVTDWRFMSTLLFIATGIASCAGYSPGEKAYWDAQIKQKCEKDGHVQIFERVQLSRQQVTAMSRSDGKVILRMQLGSKPLDEPVYARVEKETYLNPNSPEVRRTDVVAVRQSDQKVVARWIEYSRVGGDPAIGLAHHSSFHCPDPSQILSEL